jgi:hypothetical protein
MSTERFVQAQNDRLSLLALGRKMIVLAALDGVEHDVASAVKLEGVRNGHGGAETSTGKATDVLRLVEEPAGDGHVRLGEGASVRKDWRMKEVSRRSAGDLVEKRRKELTGEREDVEALVLVGVWDGRSAEERKAKDVPLASVAVCRKVRG